MRTRSLILIVLAAAIAAGCRKAAPQAVASAEAAPVAAAVLQVEPRPFAATVSVTGSLVSRSMVDVKAETTGRLLKFPKQEGEAVAAGEAVAWVDQEDYQLAIEQARAAVGVAEAALARTKVVESHSRSELERANNLLKSGGITEKDLRAAELAERDAVAQTAVAAAQLDQAHAALSTAERHLRKTVIYAPVAGEIHKKYVNPGAYLEPTTQVLSLVNNSRLELESQVPAADLGSIRSGQRVDFSVNSYPGVTFEGQVIDINPAVDADSRSAKVRIAVDNARGKLKAGMFAQGEIQTGVTSQAIVVPVQTVYRDDRSAKSAYVFVVDNGRAARRDVGIGREREQLLEITSGLQAGDTLITEQSLEIASGVRIAPRK